MEFHWLFSYGLFSKHETVFIDGTKLESAAGRYTFVWRKLTEKHLAKVKETAKAALSIHMHFETWMGSSSSTRVNPMRYF